MRTNIKLKNGEEYFLQYNYQNDHLLEIIPFKYTQYDQKSYLPDGRYELPIGYFDIQDKKIIYICYE